MAKKQLKAEEAKPKRSNNRRRGNSYEVQIMNELKALGFDVVTSRSESKNMDNMKVDLIDREGILPNCQIKKTLQYPNYIAIRDSCPLKDKPFVVIWNQQKKTDKTFRSIGEIVLLDKAYFYELIKHYYGKV